MLKQTKINYNSQQPKTMGYVASCTCAKQTNDSLCTARLVWEQKHWVATKCERKTDVWGAQESQEQKQRRGGMRRVEGGTSLLTPTSCYACLLTRI